MTPTHPPSTHRRIANALTPEPQSIPALAAALRLDPTTIHVALGKMLGLGFVRRSCAKVSSPTGKRQIPAWEMVPGVEVPADSGATRASPVATATHIGRILDALRAGPRTRVELLATLPMDKIRIYHLLAELVDAGNVTTVKLPATKGRPALLYTLAAEPADLAAFSSGRGVPAPAPTKPPEEERYEGSSGTFVLRTFPSTETVQCAREPRTVTLAACLDGYVDATATGRQSPCNQCPTGRARRADYAGCDFEESDDE